MWLLMSLTLKQAIEVANRESEAVEYLYNKNDKTKWDMMISRKGDNL